MTAHEQDIPYPDPESLPADLREAVTSRASLNIFRMITHTPGLAPGFLSMAADLLQHNSLPPTWRELAILRVGHRYRCDYELHQHVIIGRAIGLCDAGLLAAQTGVPDDLDAEHAAILQLTDELLDTHSLEGAARTAALKLLSLNQLADFTLTVGFYQLVCNFLNTFHVMPETQGAQP